MIEKLIVLGDRTANEVLETAVLRYQHDFGEISKLYFDPNKFGGKAALEIESNCSQVWFHAGVANVPVKQQIVRACEQRGWLPFTIVHPTSTIAESAKVGCGVYVGAQAVLSSNAVVGDHCIIHIHCSVGHDASVGDWCSVLPGARLSGNVKVQCRSSVGSNAFLAPGIQIGEDCQIDALAYVGQDLEQQHIASPRFPRPIRRVDI